MFMKWTIRPFGSMTYSHSDCGSYGEKGRAKSYGSKGSLQCTRVRLLTAHFSNGCIEIDS